MAVKEEEMWRFAGSWQFYGALVTNDLELSVVRAIVLYRIMYSSCLCDIHKPTFGKNRRHKVETFYEAASLSVT